MAKLNKNTILDGIGKLQSTNELTWDEIKDKHNVDMSTGEMRKRIHGILDYIDAFEEIDNEQLIEIKKEKINLMDLRSDINRKVRQYARMENIVESIKQECRDIDGFQFIDTDKVELYENGHTALLMITDMHYNGNPEIVDRFNKVIDYTINKCQMNSVNKLIVFLGGDLINNEHRTTTRIENRENISHQIVYFDPNLCNLYCNILPRKMALLGPCYLAKFRSHCILHLQEQPCNLRHHSHIRQAIDIPLRLCL